ncbi:MAG: hypothetical protein KQ78_00214 [Candidatus Izimaplasma bacterium HR2]|nr:MAG: hypothetical protein KQ78_00214 [Candidatus Izimaplasma bacterium HR2]
MIVKCKDCGKDMLLAYVTSKSLGASAVSDALKMYVASCVKCGRTVEITIEEIKVMKNDIMIK